MQPSIIISCEHGANSVPGPLAPLFQKRRHLLDSHRGYDAGALHLAAYLARSLHAPLHVFRISRLVIDANRSPLHPGLFPTLMKPASVQQKQRLLKDRHEPYREGIRRQVQELTGQGRKVVHIAAHTFTPVLRGIRRRADIGLLYDPVRPAEASCAAAWQKLLLCCDPKLRVRRNYPYKGTSDGITSWLREIFPDRCYAGIELEVNQRFVRQGASRWGHIKQALALTAQKMFKQPPVP